MKRIVALVASLVLLLTTTLPMEARAATSGSISPTSQTLATNDFQGWWSWKANGGGTAKLWFGDGGRTRAYAAGTTYLSTHLFQAWCQNTYSKTYTQRLRNGSYSTGTVLKTSTTTLRRTFLGC